MCDRDGKRIQFVGKIERFKLPFFFRTLPHRRMLPLPLSVPLKQEPQQPQHQQHQTTVAAEKHIIYYASLAYTIHNRASKVGNECIAPNEMNIACTSYYAFTQLIVLLYHFNFMKHNYHFSHSFAQSTVVTGIFSLAVRTHTHTLAHIVCSRIVCSQIVWPPCAPCKF